MILNRVYLHLYQTVAVAVHLSQTCVPLLSLCVLQTLVKVLSWQLQGQQIDIRSSYILNQIMGLRSYIFSSKL